MISIHVFPQLPFRFYYLKKNEVIKSRLWSDKPTSEKLKYKLIN